MKNNTLPALAGIGFKPQHYQQIIEQQPDIAWFEIHPENFFSEGGLPHYYLELLCQKYPLSMHGVGMNLGGAGQLNISHLGQLKNLIQRYQPSSVSEHLAWSQYEQYFLNDLLPIPYTKESLEIFINHVNFVQDYLNHELLIENPSIYITPKQADYSETQFLQELVNKTGCGLLLDINNVFVSCFNNQSSPEQYLSEFPMSQVKEIHLAGNSLKEINGQPVRIDDHGSKVMEEVWALYSSTIKQTGPIATQIEWDTDIPTLDVWLEHANTANNILHSSFIPEV